MTRAEYVRNFEPSERSEAAARFHHQIEYDQLKTEPLAPWEIQEAEEKLSAALFVDALMDANLPYSMSLLFSGRQLPEHLEGKLAKIRAGIPRPSTEQIASAAQEERHKRMQYLNSRYGCA